MVRSNHLEGAHQGGKSGSRYLGILWIPPYPSDSLDPRCILRIPTVFRIRKSLPNSHIRNTMGIRTIHRESRESRGYGGDPENPKDTTGNQGIPDPQYLQCIVCIVKVSAVSSGLSPYLGQTESAFPPLELILY
jgi:hypothetical protein